VLYQKGTWGGLATIQKTISFIQESWIEWFIPNLAILALLLWLDLQAESSGVAQLLALVPAGAVLHLLMVFRGYLFMELDGSSHRQRMFKYRKA